MSEMIERVARAIHFRGDDQGDDAWNHCQSYLRYIAREQARAAIEAMRDPSDEMSDACTEETIGYYADGPDLTTVWHTMIDAALHP